MRATVSRTRVSAPPSAEGPRARRWTREEYHRAADRGLFRPEERLELLDGEIIDKMTRNSPHAAAVARIARLLSQVFGGDHHAGSRSPIILKRDQ